MTQKYFYNSNLLIYSFLILPFAFFFGPALVELFLLLILIFSLSYKSELIIKNNFLYGLILFYIIILANLLFTDNVSYLKSIGFIRIIIFILVIHFILQFKKNQIIEIFDRYKYLVFLFLLIIFFHSIYLYISDNTTIRVSSVLGDEKILGSVISKFLFFFLTIYFISNDQNSKKNKLLFVIIFISTVIVVLSAERTALFNLMFYLSLFFIFTNSITNKSKIYIITLIFVSVILVIFSSDRLKFRLVDQTLSQLGIYGPDKYEEKIINGVPRAYLKEDIMYFAPAKHRLMHLTSINIFKKNVVLGSGLKTFRYLCSKREYLEEYIHPSFIYNYIPGISAQNVHGFSKKDGCSSHPHNYFFETLAELGFISFILILFLFTSCTYFLIRYKKQLNNFHYSLLLPTFVLFFPLNSSGSLLNNFNLCFLAIFVGFYYYFINYELPKLQKKK